MNICTYRLCKSYTNEVLGVLQLSDMGDRYQDLANIFGRAVQPMSGRIYYPNNRVRNVQPGHMYHLQSLSGPTKKTQEPGLLQWRQRLSSFWMEGEEEVEAW